MIDVERNAMESYEQCLESGRVYLRDSWRRLALDGEPVQEWLVRSGHYTQYGKPIIDPNEERDNQVEQLEYVLGKICLCLKAKLPSRQDRNATVPGEAIDGELLTVISAMLVHPYGKTADFLRSALLAIQKHSEANLLVTLPPPKVVTNKGAIAKFVFHLVTIGATLLIPIFLSDVLASAARGDNRSTTASMYFLGIVAWMIYATRKDAKFLPESPDEQAYRSWCKLRFGDGGWVTTGAGAKIYLEDMLRRGLPIPVLALDVAAALEAATLSSRSNHQVVHDPG